jgi:hypothetical protein
MMNQTARITAYRPGPKRIKTFIVRLALYILGRALASASRFDVGIAREVAEWEEGFAFALKVLPHGPGAGWQKQNGRLRFLGSATGQADLEVRFKNLESAFLVLTPQLSIHAGFAQHRMAVHGDLARCMSLVRCLNRVIVYLYPACISRRLLKSRPQTGFDLLGRRLYLYAVGIPFKT